MLQEEDLRPCALFCERSEGRLWSCEDAGVWQEGRGRSLCPHPHAVIFGHAMRAVLGLVVVQVRTGRLSSQSHCFMENTIYCCYSAASACLPSVHTRVAVEGRAVYDLAQLGNDD